MSLTIPVRSSLHTKPRSELSTMPTHFEPDQNSNNFLTFFQTKDTKSALQSFNAKLQTYTPSSEFEKHRNSAISKIIQSISETSNSWDIDCQISILHLREDFSSYLQQNQENTKTTVDLDILFSYCYQFLYEKNMSHYVSLDKNLNGILIFVKENIEKFSPQARQYIEMTESTLVTRVLKRIYGSTEIKSILMIENFESNVAKRIGRWDAKLTERERKVESYNKELQKHESAFNFVGLYEGFENLMKEKQKEQTIYVGWIIFLGVAIIAVLFAKILSILISPPDATDPITYLLCASILALLAALLYFFRIALLNFKSIKSQILQIQLRQTLCRFIQGYVDYKRDGEKLGKVDLSMFEKLIFSNIVAGEEQIPSTFDSLDHLASIIKTIKS